MARSPDEQKRYDEEQAAQQRKNEDEAKAQRESAERRSAGRTLPAEEPQPDRVGAQVVIAPDSDASRAARGTLHPTLEQNSEAFEAERQALLAEQRVADAQAKLQEAQAHLDEVKTARDEQAKPKA